MKREQPLSDIPALARALVKVRARNRCERCGMPGSHWHHRRSRNVKDQHTHCPCNGVLLCGTCHQWAHANPFQARKEGWIISRYTDRPETVPVQTKWGGRTHNCDAGFETVTGHT